jgi:hypothetical protein
MVRKCHHLLILLLFVKSQLAFFTNSIQFPVINTKKTVNIFFLGKFQLIELSLNESSRN